MIKHNSDNNIMITGKPAMILNVITTIFIIIMLAIFIHEVYYAIQIDHQYDVLIRKYNHLAKLYSELR